MKINAIKIVITRCLVLASILLVSSMGVRAQQRFFNLTVDDVTIDSMLPHFTYAIPIGEHYADSTYELEIRYPEFMDMSADDIERYNQVTKDVPPTLPAITKQVVVERKQGRLEFSLVPIVKRNGKMQFLVSFMIAVTSKPLKRSAMRMRARASVVAADRYAAHSVLSSGRWVKIRVPADNVYQLTDNFLRQAGFTNPSRVKLFGYGGHLQNEMLDGNELAETDDLSEVPTCTVGGKRLFYGRGPVSWDSNNATRRTRNPYSNYGYYFLTESDTEPLKVDSTDFLNSFYPSANDYHALHEVDNFSWYQGGRNLFENTPINVGASKVYTLANQAHATAGKLSVAVTAGVNSVAQVALNDSVLGTINITLGSYDKGNEATSVYNVSGLHATDSITIKTLSGGPIRLDYVSMAYNKPRQAPNLNAATFATPEYLYAITNQDHHADAAADMVIIIPTSQKLFAQAQRLADFHKAHDNFRVNIVPADELYNEFSSGTPDANAYRRYLKMLYDRATTAADMPKYLLLFGDCVWDNRMLVSDTRNLNPDDYLLAFESENSFNEVTCYVDDGWFTLLDDGEGINPQRADKQDMAVGRIPVTEESDAEAVVDKTIAYASNHNAGDWQNIITFMGDDGNDNLHMTDVNSTAETVSARYPGYRIKKIMWDAYTRESTATGNRYPEVSSAIKSQQAAGALIMDYAGHGSAIQISHEAVLRLTDFQNFTNANLPLWITASCDIMPFDGTEATIGEAALLNKNGGAVAFFGTTRTVYSNYNKAINTSYLLHVLSMTDGKPITLGEAQRLAKNEMITTGQDRTTNKLQYSLLGDPALQLALPTKTAVIDSINGLPVNESNMPVLKAGAVVNVKGHIADSTGVASYFTGKLTATVRDVKELITCRKNDPTQRADAFTYYDRPNVLFNGSDSVRAGYFSFTFAVPRDINYGDGTGLMNLYAVSSDYKQIANGYNSDFCLNGTAEATNDSIGPSIYCYLNTSSFTNGGDVNDTPYFYAKISDKDGINCSGSGIGHDLQLVVDGDMNQTYTLNSNFSYDFGSYTSGCTWYNLPQLTPGRHSLKFRAWDMMGNSSTTELQFNVVKDLAPDIASLGCTENPATSQTTFIVTHNFTGAQVNVTIEVFDVSGKILWQHEATANSSGNAVTVNWDLTTSNGNKLPTGVYLYRAKLSSGSNSKTSKAKKLIVIGNN